MKLKFKGIINKIIDKSTISVIVFRVKTDSKYNKQMKVSKKYLVDTNGVEYEVGDEVEFETTKPISKRKRFITIKGK